MTSSFELKFRVDPAWYNPIALPLAIVTNPAPDELTISFQRCLLHVL